MISYRSLKMIIDEKNEMLEKVITDRSKAFRYAAHELKAPLTAIKSTLEVVKDLYRKDLNSEVLEMIFRSERRANQVLSMVKELIAITQYNLSLEIPQYKIVDFNNWLYQAVILHKAEAVNKNIELSFIDLSKSLRVELDKIGLDEVVSNLISNALVYTPKGGKVVIEPFIENDRFGFSVSDTGIGISEDDIGKIFDEFTVVKMHVELKELAPVWD